MSHNWIHNLYSPTAARDVGEDAVEAVRLGRRRVAVLLLRVQQRELLRLVVAVQVDPFESRI
jgi:hypothetical protein